MNSTTTTFPEYWRIAKLKEVGQIISGGTPTTSISEFWNGGISWITPADLSNYNNKYISKGKKTISMLGLKKSSARLLPRGSVLFSSRAPIGYVAIAGSELATNQGFKSVIPDSCLNNHYLYYYLKSIKSLVEQRATGTTFKEISASAFSELQIPLPPIKVQKAIVQKIEELFSELDKGVEQLETLQQQLKVYRQAVLKQAFEGKLTEEWRKLNPPTQTAEELLGEIKAEREKLAKEQGKKLKEVPPLTEEELRELPELPKGWHYSRIERLTSKITDGEHFRPQTQESGIYFLSAKDIRDKGVALEEPLFISEATAKKALERCNAELGDILMVSRGATVGRMCLVNITDTFCLLGSVILVKPLKIINNRFLLYALKNPALYRKLINLSGSTAQQAIYLRDLKGVPIPVLPVSEQNQIVQEIECRFSVCDKLEETIQESLKQAKVLRQCILKKAFNGELVKEEVL